MKVRMWILAALWVFGAAACGSSTVTVTPTDESASEQPAAAADDDDAESDVDEVSVEDEADSEPVSYSFSAVEALEQIPASVIEEGDRFEFYAANVVAAADIARVRAPASDTDLDQLIRYLDPLTGRSQIEKMRVFVAFPAWLLMPAGSPVELVDELGFGLGQITSFATLDALPNRFTVLEGVEVRTDLPTVAEGVMSLGEGEDLSIDLNGRSVARQLGRPLRIASRSSQVGLSLTTPQLVAWAAESGAPTMAGNPFAGPIATRLDEVGVVSAMIFGGSSGVAYRSTGFGWNEDDGGPLGVLVLSYANDGEADAALTGVTRSLDPAADVGRPMGEVLTVDSIDLRGSEIVAVVRFPDETSRPSVLFDMLLRGEGPFG